MASAEAVILHQEAKPGVAETRASGKTRVQDTMEMLCWAEAVQQNKSPAALVLGLAMFVSAARPSHSRTWPGHGQGAPVMFPQGLRRRYYHYPHVFTGKEMGVQRGYML